jgi:hypothetical protein
MGLEGLPEKISSLEDVQRVELAINRGMQQVNLSSLLTNNWKKWHPYIQAQMPEGVKLLLDGDGRNRGYWPGELVAAGRLEWPAAKVTWQREIALEQEANETFQVEQV